MAVDAATSVTGHVRAPARANSCPCVRVRVRVCTHAWHARGVCPSSLVPVCTAGQQHASHARARGGSTGSEVRAPRARARLAARAWRKGSARLPRAAPSAVALAARASARGAITSILSNFWRHNAHSNTHRAAAHWDTDRG